YSFGDDRASFGRIAFCADGKRVFAQTGYRAVVWDISTATKTLTLDTGEDVYATALNPDGQLALTGGKFGTAALWDMNTGKKLFELVGHTKYDEFGHMKDVTRAAFTPDGKLALPAGTDGVVIRWAAATGKTAQLA